MSTSVAFRNVINTNSKSFCSCLVKKGMNLEEALESICKVYSAAIKNFDLTGVHLKELGIDTTCFTSYSALLTEILNALIQNDIDFAHQIELITKTLNSLTVTSTTSTDEKVKASATDPAAGYLGDKLLSLQPGSISIQNNGVYFIGFVPIGAVMMINKSRIVDFDGTGKGKSSTDLWGYAISNGANGTVNRLGKMIKYTDDPVNAGKTGGADTVKLTEAHLPSMTLGVTGTISEALVNPVTPRIKTRTFGVDINGTNPVTRNNYFGNINGEDAIGLPLDVKHSHTFSLTATKTNPVPTDINLLPAHILEIPIERITV